MRIYTNKKYLPSIHKEAIVINSWDLLKRMPGENIFASAGIRANVIARVFRGITKVEHKIRRAIKLQAAQVLQTGKIIFRHTDGKEVRQLDYKPKASHFHKITNLGIQELWLRIKLLGRIN